MIKARLTQSFKDIISELQDTFELSGNSCSDIVKRALRWYKSNPFNIPELKEIGVGSPITIRVETELNNKDVQMVVIIYGINQLDKNRKRIYPDVKCETTVNFRIDGE